MKYKTTVKPTDASFLTWGTIMGWSKDGGRQSVAWLGLLVLVAGFLAVPPLVAKELASDSAAEGWPGYGNDSKEQRFSPLTEINDGNVGRLGLAWSLDLAGENALEATPLEVNGGIYFSGSNNAVYAVDARSGRLLWKYDSNANANAPREIRMIWPVNRGVAYWDGMIYVGTRDCRITALDARTGKPLWSSSFLVPGIISTSSGAPRVFKGKVIIGNSGADFGGRGYVTTFDAKTGKLLWRFFTVPGDPAMGFESKAMAMAAKTWGGTWWKFGGGGTPWNAITFDEELNQVYVGTGNGGPANGNFRAPHKEDNLFLTSVVALDATTGEYRWHYQYNPQEVWDWKATADIILTDLKIDGRLRKVLMQAPSNGFFYVIDRYTGKVISAEKIGKVTWADRIDLKTGRPIERPGIRGENGPVTIYPDYIGAHNWQAMSYSPKTGLVYIPYMQLGMKYGPVPAPTEVGDVTENPSIIMVRWGVPNKSIVLDPNDPLDGRGSLLAWDPVSQKLRWRVNYPTLANAGTMTTAGNLVFQGTDTGRVFAYSADNGKKRWEFDAKLGILAPPISYAVDHHQYVCLLVGSGGMVGYGPLGGRQGWKYGLQPRRLLAFALDAKAKLPATPPADFTVKALDDPSITLDPARVEQGKSLYGATCYLCHGGGTGISAGGGTAPDLRESAVALNRISLEMFLRSGSVVSRGMPLFDDLTADQVENIYQAIRSEARAARSKAAERSP
jgi:quinohemoprotein ethanol dehydrogenase